MMLPSVISTSWRLRPDGLKDMAGASFPDIFDTIIAGAAGKNKRHRGRVAEELQYTP